MELDFLPLLRYSTVFSTVLYSTCTVRTVLYLVSCSLERITELTSDNLKDSSNLEVKKKPTILPHNYATLIVCPH